MKKQLLMLALTISASFAMPARAQEVNVSFQPTWGPVGYNYVNYYYLPDIEAYYSVPLQQFTYFNGAQWVSTPDLPPRYANFDLFAAYKVVINDPNPWYHHDLYRGRYYHYRGMHNEGGLIRESHDHRYFDGRRDAFRHDGFRHDEVRHDEARGGEGVKRGGPFGKIGGAIGRKGAAGRVIAAKKK